MGVRSSRQRLLLEELSEWLEDIGTAGIGSRVVLVEVPPGWGAAAVLADFAAVVTDPEGPLALVASTDEVSPADRPVEARALGDALLAPLDRSRLTQLLGLDSPAGKLGLALGVSGLFLSGPTAAVSLLLAPYAATAAQNLWDASPAGQQGTLARSARAVAAVSVQIPVVVLVGDADRLDATLAALMIDNLASRPDGRVLVVAEVREDSELAAALRAPGRYGLLGRVVVAEADADMSAASRTALARELLPALAATVTERIGQRTTTFDQVLWTAAERKLADVAGTDGPDAVQVVDVVIDAALPRALPSAQAGVLAWAGGALTGRQADRAVEVIGEQREAADDPDVVRAGGLARLRDPAADLIRRQVGRLATADRRSMAEVILREAAGIGAGTDATLIERTVAQLAAHRVRDDLSSARTSRGDLAEVQCLLVRGLEQLGDAAAARRVAESALAELPREPGTSRLRAELLTACLRLAGAGPHADDPLVDEAVGLAADSALFGTEARVWACVNLLRRPGSHEAALKLVDRLTIDLQDGPDADPAAVQWRLLLAFHAGQAGYPGLGQQLLAPLVSNGTTDQQKAAQAVLRAIDDPRADVRLQIIILENELEAVAEIADDDRLRLHHALAEDYAQLGNHQRALEHGIEELRYRLRLQGPSHPDTLTIRSDIAAWTGECGDFPGALRLYQELLPDRTRVLGADHPGVLHTRSNIAAWTGECHDAAGALRLFQELLPDYLRVLGRDDRGTLNARTNIAAWTGTCGDHRGALRLSRELLPDQARVLGPDHLEVLRTRHHIARWTGECGYPESARQQDQDVLADQVRVLGPDHPDVLTTRSHIARWAGRSGDAAGALRLFRELLPDRVRVLGPDHPDVLTTRSHIGTWMVANNDMAGALRVFRDLLPDQVRVLGPHHPYVLTTRENIVLLEPKTHPGTSG